MSSYLSRYGPTGSLLSVSSASVAPKYIWPGIQLHLWNIVMLATGVTILSISVQFLLIQQQMQLATPWIFPYAITIGLLTVLILAAEIVMIIERVLVPGITLVAAFVLLILYMTGLIETAIQLFGPKGSISSNCREYVYMRKQYGVSINTLAWLAQSNICSCWYATFSFWLIGCVWQIWMIVLSFQVSNDVYLS